MTFFEYFTVIIKNFSKSNASIESQLYGLKNANIDVDVIGLRTKMKELELKNKLDATMMNYVEFQK